MCIMTIHTIETKFSLIKGNTYILINTFDQIPPFPHSCLFNFGSATLAEIKSGLWQSDAASTWSDTFTWWLRGYIYHVYFDSWYHDNTRRIKGINAMIVSMILSMIAPTYFYVTTLTTLTVSSCVTHYESNIVSIDYLHQVLLQTPTFY